MRKALIVVDYQNDFVTGALGFEKAKTLEKGIADKMMQYANEGHTVILTKDCHGGNYLETREGKHLPVPHCLIESEGADFHGLVKETVDYIDNNIEGGVEIIYKNTFGAAKIPCKFTLTDPKLKSLPKRLDYDEIELVGIVTNMCVISMAVSAQTQFPNAEIVIDASLCASFNDELHEKALDVMEGLQMTVINKEVK